MEVVVVVDGPDASTNEALSGIGDSRLRIVNLPISRGGSAARNAGVQAANGEWVAFLDDDDEWLPRKIELQLSVAGRSARRVPIVMCRMIARTPLADYVWPRRLPEPGQPIDEYLLCRKSVFHSRGVIQSSSLLTKRDLLLRVPFRDGLKKHQDWDWVLRAAGQEGVGFDFESSPLTVFNIDPTLPGISNRKNDWQFSFSWIQEMRPYVSPRAYASFILSDVAEMAARVASPREYWTLLIHSMKRGKPVLTDVMRYATVGLFPHDVRSRLRFWLGRISEKTKQVLRGMGLAGAARVSAGVGLSPRESRGNLRAHFVGRAQ
jgi:glycosyltransferase involved in cell wall biosynthesis